MNFKRPTRLIGLCSALLVIGFMLVLTGCNRSSLTLQQAPISRQSKRGPVQSPSPLPPSPTHVPPTTTPTLIGLPEAGGPRQTKSRSSLTPPPTAVPVTPTALPVTPTATATEMSAPSSPTPAPQLIPSRLIIPAISLDAPIIAVGWTVSEQDGQMISEWDVPSDREVGWLNNSAPVGTVGNTVLVGHQNVDGRVFENLEFLQPGNEIQVVAGDQLRRYTIAFRTIVPEKDQPLEVRLANARWIGRSNDERITLVTCWPRNDNTHRLILVALPAA